MPSVTRLPDLDEVTMQRKSSSNTKMVGPEWSTPPPPEGIPKMFEYEILPARVGVGSKLADLLRKMRWPSSDVIKMGWQGEAVFGRR